MAPEYMLGTRDQFLTNPITSYYGPSTPVVTRPQLPSDNRQSAIARSSGSLPAGVTNSPAYQTNVANLQRLVSSSGNPYIRRVLGRFMGGQPEAGEAEDKTGYTVEELAALGMMGGGSSGGGLSAAERESIANQIREQYAAQRNFINQNQLSARQEIENIYNQFVGNVGNIGSSGEEARLNQRDRSVAAAQALIDDFQQRANMIGESTASVGPSTGAVSEYQKAAMAQMVARRQAEESLYNQMNESARQYLDSLRGGGELVRQGARGTLDVGVASLLNQLAQQEQQSIDEAIASALGARSGGGGGGGMNPLAALEKAAKTYNLLNPQEDEIDVNSMLNFAIQSRLEGDNDAAAAFAQFLPPQYRNIFLEDEE